MLLPMITAYEKEHISERQPLPDAYLGLSDEDMDSRIAEARRKLGDRVIVLGHHYQRDEVIKFADYTGDSYKLAQQVSQHPKAEFIVFCGVHFMAESADVLTAPHQQVILPDLAAGCSMADMAAPDQLEQCWADLEQMLGPAQPSSGALLQASTSGAPLQPSTSGAPLHPSTSGAPLHPSTSGAPLHPSTSGAPLQRCVPVTYINSAASIKAFVGEHGGVVCTSSNAAATLKWAWEH